MCGKIVPVYAKKYLTLIEILIYMDKEKTFDFKDNADNPARTILWKY